MGQGNICHILGQVMKPAISIYNIKIKCFNTIKIMTEKARCKMKKVSCDVNGKNNLNIQKKI